MLRRYKKFDLVHKTVFLHERVGPGDETKWSSGLLALAQSIPEHARPGKRVNLYRHIIPASIFGVLTVPCSHSQLHAPLYVRLKSQKVGKLKRKLKYQTENKLKFTK